MRIQELWNKTGNHDRLEKNFNELKTILETIGLELIIQKEKQDDTIQIVSIADISNSEILIGLDFTTFEGYSAFENTDKEVLKLSYFENLDDLITWFLNQDIIEKKFEIMEFCNLAEIDIQQVDQQDSQLEK
ncbi:MAG: hypothetical protein ACRDCC_08360 [Culicoidibacterales bacterium]